jgi:hypothetical protein
VFFRVSVANNNLLGSGLTTLVPYQLNLDQKWQNIIGQKVDLEKNFNIRDSVFAIQH